MKKFIKIIISLFIVLIFVAIVVPFLVPLDSYKDEITSVVKEKTGRELVIEGHIKANVFPILGVKIGKASISNPSGFKEKNMVEIDGLTLEVGLLALLQKQLQIKEFILTKPLINLEINSDGKPNWQFSALDDASNEKTSTPKENNTKEKEASSNPTALLAGLVLGDIKITDGEINYKDRKNNSNIAVTKLNLKSSLKSLRQPFSAEGDAVWNNEKVIINASATKPDNIISGKISDFEFELKSSPINLNYVGKISQTKAEGKVDLNIPSIPRLAKWLEVSFGWQGASLLDFGVKGELNASASSVSLNNAQITLDSTKLSGNIKANLDEKVPAIEAKLESDLINLNPYLQASPAKTSWLIGSAIAAEFSDQRIDLSGLNAANAKINLTLGSIVYEKVNLGKTIINADLNNGKLNLNIPEISLYGGSTKIICTLDSTGAFTKQLNISHVNIGELAGDLSNHNRFTGVMNGSVNLNGKLTSMQGMMKSLGGNGSIKITDGAIKGIDLKNMVNNIKSAFANVDNSKEQTAFSGLGGTFTINQGIVANNDLSLKADLLTLSGKGTVNLPMQNIQYHLIPVVVSTVKNGDGSSTKGLEVPIIIEGPLDNPRFIPDLAGMVQNSLSNPNALKNTVKSLKQQFKGGKTDLKDVQDLLKGFGQ